MSGATRPPSPATMLTLARLLALGLAMLITRLLLLFTFCMELLLEWRTEGWGEGEELR